MILHRMDPNPDKADKEKNGYREMKIRQLTFMQFREVHFWILVFLIILLRLALTADLAIQMIYAPHDHGLYVSRAFCLLSGKALGPYDARLLVKLPGLSFWLAGNRMLGIPYLLSINLFYIFSGIYFITALLHRYKVNLVLLLLIWALYLFNPVTLDHQWFSVLREPLAICLFVLMFGSMLFIIDDIRGQRIPLLHLIIFSATFAFSLLVREEDRLLFGMLFLFDLYLIWLAKKWNGLRTIRAIIRLAFVCSLPLVIAYGSDALARSFINKHYGCPIIYDFGEGEFSKLIAAMRSIETSKQNRYVMITQEILSKLRQTVPSLIPVIDRLPPPSLDSLSCQRFKVCSEWANGWMLFWVKDAAFQAGLTADLPKAQEYFRKARLEIEQACADGRLTCRKNGTGLLPPFQLRWIRAFFQEAIRIMKMMTQPGMMTVDKLPLTYPVDMDYGRIYQMVTMTHHYDTHLQSGSVDEQWKNYPADLYLSLKYWLRYPDVAASKEFSPNALSEQLGALKHYQNHGKHEGRNWLERKASDEYPFLYNNPLKELRAPIIKIYQRYGLFLELAGMIAFLFCLVTWQRRTPGIFFGVASLFIIFTLFRLIVMSYVSIYMGYLDVRLFFSTYVVTFLLTPLILMEGAHTMRIYLSERKNHKKLEKGKFYEDWPPK